MAIASSSFCNPPHWGPACTPVRYSKVRLTLSADTTPEIQREEAPPTRRKSVTKRVKSACNKLVCKLQRKHQTPGEGE